MKGGYKIIDLGGINFTADGAAMMIEGIHDSIEARYDKPLLLEGLVVGGSEYSAIWVVPTLAGGAYVINAYQYVITVEDTDTVSVANI